MRILFDQGTPVLLRRYLSNHSVDTAFERDGPTFKIASCFRQVSKMTTNS